MLQFWASNVEQGLVLKIGAILELKQTAQPEVIYLVSLFKQNKTKKTRIKYSCLVNSLGINSIWPHKLHYMTLQSHWWFNKATLAIFRAKQSADAQGQRTADSTHSSDRPVTVSGCWRINRRSRKRGLRIRSCSISEGSHYSTGTISKTTLQALYNCCLLSYKQTVFIIPSYSTWLLLKKKINK